MQMQIGPVAWAKTLRAGMGGNRVVEFAGMCKSSPAQLDIFSKSISSITQMYKFNYPEV